LIQPNDEDFTYYELPLRDILEISQVHGKDPYYRIKEVLETLLQRTIFIPQGEKDFLITHWVSAAKYISKKGVICLKFEPEMKPYLLQLKSHFTQFRLGYVAPLRSKNSIRVYEILKMELRGRKEATYKVNLSELREILAPDEEFFSKNTKAKKDKRKPKYPLYADFKRFVLLPAQKEIEQYTDISFTFSECREGKKITSLVFIISKQDQPLQQLMLGEPIENLDEQETETKETAQNIEIVPEPKIEIKDESIKKLEERTEQIKYYGVSHAKALEIAKKVTTEDIEEAAHLMEDIKKRKPITNPAGLFLSLLENGAVFESPHEKELKKKKEEEQKAAKLKRTAGSLQDKLRQDYNEYTKANRKNILQNATQEDYEEFRKQKGFEFMNKSLIAEKNVSAQIVQESGAFFNFLCIKYINENQWKTEQARRLGYEISFDEKNDLQILSYQQKTL
jgi:plasmid replication initiation protein